MDHLTLEQLRTARDLVITYAASFELALWLIALSGLAQMAWGFYRDHVMLTKNKDYLAWDNERAVLLANCEKAEAEAKRWRNTHDGVVELTNRLRQANTDLRKRLDAHGLDATH